MPGLGQQLPQILGALNSLRGGGGAFAQRWRELEAQAQQQKLQEQQLAEQTRRGQSADDRAQQGLMLQADAAERARQGQAISGVNSIRQLLEDETLDSPEAYDSREAFALNTAPLMGIDPGFVKTLRPQPTVFQTRQAKKKLAEIEKAYNPAQLMELEQGAVFDLGGERLTIAQLRERAGTAALDAQTGQPRAVVPTVRPDVPNSPEERLADAIRRGDTQEIAVLSQAAETIAGARRKPEDQELSGINKQLAQMRLEAAQRAATATAALPAPLQRRVDMKARAFDQQPVVKRIQTMAEAVQFAEGLNPNTKNPADDQALIYNFAKAMDPESVVREGEYATVQKYAQSWAERFGFDVARIYSNTTFLTPEARANMKATIRSRYQAAKPQYDNLRRGYAQQIDQITKQGDGESYLIDYAAGFPSARAGQGSGGKIQAGSIVRDKNGQRARVTGFTAEGRAILEPVQ